MVDNWLDCAVAIIRLACGLVGLLGLADEFMVDNSAGVMVNNRNKFASWLRVVGVIGHPGCGRSDHIVINMNRFPVGSGRQQVRGAVAVVVMANDINDVSVMVSHNIAVLRSIVVVVVSMMLVRVIGRADDLMVDNIAGVSVDDRNNFAGWLSVVGVIGHSGNVALDVK